MINPHELFVGLRYLRAKRRTRFVSFITLISLLGIALGVGGGVALGATVVAPDASDWPQPLQNALPPGFVRWQFGHAESSAVPHELQNFAS